MEDENRPADEKMANQAGDIQLNSGTDVTAAVPCVGAVLAAAALTAAAASAKTGEKDKEKQKQKEEEKKRKAEEKQKQKEEKQKKKAEEKKRKEQEKKKKEAEKQKEKEKREKQKQKEKEKKEKKRQKEKEKREKQRQKEKEKKKKQREKERKKKQKKKEKKKKKSKKKTSRKMAALLGKVITCGKAASKTSDIKYKINKQKRKNKSRYLKQRCFTGDMLVVTKDGYQPIQEIRTGDDIYSRNEDTGETAVLKVTGIFCSQAHTVYSVCLDGREVVKTTAYHPFFIIGNGWVNAIHLCEGMSVETRQGTAQITGIWKERHEEPVTVYNLHVEGWNTYFVSGLQVYVHNEACDWGNLAPAKENVDKYIRKKAKLSNNEERSEAFEKVLDDYARIYAEHAVASNVPWSWCDSIPGGDSLTKGQKKKIKQRAMELEPSLKVPMIEVPGLKYGEPDFRAAGVVKFEFTMPDYLLTADSETLACLGKTEDDLPIDLWKETDKVQFAYLNKIYKEYTLREFGKEETTKGFTWHHTLESGVMQLVPFGIHNIIPHNGGRTSDQWAHAQR